MNLASLEVSLGDAMRKARLWNELITWGNLMEGLM